MTLNTKAVSYPEDDSLVPDSIYGLFFTIKDSTDELRKRIMVSLPISRDDGTLTDIYFKARKEQGVIGTVLKSYNRACIKEMFADQSKHLYIELVKNAKGTVTSTQHKKNLNVIKTEIAKKYGIVIDPSNFDMDIDYESNTFNLSAKSESYLFVGSISFTIMIELESLMFTDNTDIPTVSLELNKE